MRRKNNNKEEDKDPIFNNLTPCDSVSLDGYDKAFNYVFGNDEIRNIAISGPYGSGKSSVLYSFIKNSKQQSKENKTCENNTEANKQKKKKRSHSFLNITLARFSESKECDNSDIAINNIEGKIINQLIHQIPEKRIPKTKFRVISSERKLLLSISLVVYFVFSFFLIIAGFFHNNQSLIEDFFLKKTLVFISSATFISISFFLWIIPTTWFLYKIVNALITRRILSKINFKGNEIELFTESKSLYFDRYLNDVLYLFENIPQDVIIFEDIDRFEDVQVFERLREINKLANDRRCNSKKRVLRFFYLLRDDIFTSKDRTKFFDFIIPIVPVVDGSNSYDQMHEILKQMEMLQYLDRSFLKGLSVYIDDMRLIKNICNELYIYNARLKGTAAELNFNKLLALITYKNIFPADFSDLQLNRGYVYALFSHKNEFVAEEAERIDKSIEEIEGKIKQKEENSIINRERLNDLTDYYSRYKRPKFNHWTTVEYPALERLLSVDIEPLKENLGKQEERKRKLRMLSLMEIINDNNASFVFDYPYKDNLGTLIDYSEIKRNQYYGLLRFLIRNGYIDESYPDYMTYFYQTDMKSVDKLFIRSVHEGGYKDSDYKLANPALVFDYLKPIDFEKPQVLNYDLLDFLMISKNCDDYLYYLIEQFKNSNSLVFLEKYYTHTSYKEKLVTRICSKWPEVFARFLVDSGLSPSFIHSFAVSCILYLGDDSLLRLNDNNVFSNYVENNDEFLSIGQPVIDKMIKGFSVLNILFSNINYKVSNKELFYAIYENGLFEMSPNMIATICKYLFHASEGNDVEVAHRATTIILKNPDSIMFKKMNEKPNDYLESILEMAHGRINDDEQAIIYLLNNTLIEASNKKNYIQALKTRITRLDVIDSHNCWSDLIHMGCIESSGNNVESYYKAFGVLDEIVIGYINDSETPILFNNIDCSENLWDSIVACNEIKDSQYESILGSSKNKKVIHILRKAIDDTMSESKVSILIDLGIVEMNEANLSYVKETYNNLFYYFIKTNFTQFHTLFDSNSDIITKNDLEVLLSDQNVPDQDKILLVENSRYQLTTTTLKVSNQVKMAILKNCPDEAEYPFYYSEYSSIGDDLKSVVAQIAKNQLVKDEYSSNLSSDLLRDVLAIEKNRKEKLIILSNILEFLDYNLFERLTSENDLQEYSEIFHHNRRPTFKNTEEDCKLLERIKRKGWIVSFDINSRNLISIHRGKTFYID